MSEPDLMTEDEFWSHVASIDQAALAAGDQNAAVSPLRESLERVEVGKLEAFEELLTRKLYEIDGEQYAKRAGEAGQSDDAFLHARAFVVARGREFYQGVRTDPRKMPRTPNAKCEALLSVAREAWSEVTGSEESDWEFDASVSWETGSNAALWPKLRR